MSRKRLVLQERIAGPRELRERYRYRGDDRVLMIRSRPGMLTGDEVLVAVSLEAAPQRLELHGQIEAAARTVILDGRKMAMAEVKLSAASASRLEPYVMDVRRYSGAPRRVARRRATQQWSECRLVSTPVTRACQIVDASPGGAFLATGLEVSAGETIFFRTGPGRPWLAGAVRWLGTKLGHAGFGLQLSFSRTAERHAWNDWYVSVDAAAV